MFWPLTSLLNKNGPRAQVYDCCSQPISLPSAYFPTQRVVWSRDPPNMLTASLKGSHTRPDRFSRIQHRSQRLSKRWYFAPIVTLMPEISRLTRFTPGGIVSHIITMSTDSSFDMVIILAIKGSWVWSSVMSLKVNRKNWRFCIIVAHAKSRLCAFCPRSRYITELKSCFTAGSNSFFPSICNKLLCCQNSGIDSTRKCGSFLNEFSTL